MNRKISGLLALCLLLTGCTGLAASEPMPLAAGEPEMQAAVEIYQAPAYEIIPLTAGEQIRSEDQADKTLAVCNYQTVLLALRNEDDVSPADRETARRNIEAFNAKMEDLLAESREYGLSVGEDARTAYKEGFLREEYYDDMTASAAFVGELISVQVDRGSYTGGAHPNRYTSGLLFDLRTGQFIDPAQLADDPAAFQSGAAELLLEKAEAHPERKAFWQDYPDIIARWSEGTVLFDETGMRIVYSPYELGPYAMGDIEFRLNWEELAPVLGPGGMAWLGQETAAE